MKWKNQSFRGTRSIKLPSQDIIKKKIIKKFKIFSSDMLVQWFTSNGHSTYTIWCSQVFSCWDPSFYWGKIGANNRILTQSTIVYLCTNRKYQLITISWFLFRKRQSYLFTVLQLILNASS